jgi:hypothetical protein
LFSLPITAHLPNGKITYITPKSSKNCTWESSEIKMPLKMMRAMVDQETEDK